MSRVYPKYRGPVRFAFRIYVAGAAPYSARAVDNLRNLCKRTLGDSYELDIIDVLRDPHRALEDGIFVTPTLVKLAPSPARTLIGDLSDEMLVMSSLDLPAPRGSDGG